MSFHKAARKCISLFLVASSVLLCGAGPLGYAETPRDTRYTDTAYTLPKAKLDDGYRLLHETEEAAFYLKEERNVIAVVDKRIGYTWKTGLDAPFPAQTDALVFDLTPAEIAEQGFYKEARLNTTYTGMANSIFTIEYYDSTNTKKTTSSGAYENVETGFEEAGVGHYIMTSRFYVIDLEIKVHIHFEGASIRYDIYNHEITGDGRRVLSTLYLTPFLGASGGAINWYDAESEMFDRFEAKPIIPGYVLVPDGSGALIRFADNSMSFTEYSGYVYGRDLAQAPYYYAEASNIVPPSNPSLPVFGITHGNDQAAFVAYAAAGGENMEIVVLPEENMTYYTYAYPRFRYNDLYYQVFNKRGDGYFQLLSEMNRFDISMVYEFIAPGDGIEANYVGMAQKYREHLVENGQLQKRDKKKDASLRVDFLMSDIKKNIIFYKQEVLTDTNGVRAILEDLQNAGIHNMNVSLLGWQKNGITGAKPWAVSYTSKVGSKKDFEALFAYAEGAGIEMALAQEYVEFNTIKTGYLGNAAIHANSWHIINDITKVVPGNAPVKEIAYARPVKSTEWLASALKKLSYSSFHTISGLSSYLLSDYTGGQARSVTDSMNTIVSGVEAAGKSHTLNMVKPNLYLLPYTSNYLDIPVFSSQHLIETDTVPFLQLVLRDSMTMYASYSNFFFFAKGDMLRMIDYNVYPSFVVTEQASHLLQSTNSADFYSTEYGKHKALIVEIYETVAPVLSKVADYKWADRNVIGPGVVVNRYEKEGETAYVVINYTNNAANFNGHTVAASSALFIDDLNGGAQ